jgi:hypothetical protein
MDAKILELGVGVIAAVLIIREVLSFLGKHQYKRNGNGGGNEHTAVMKDHVDDMRDDVKNLRDKVDDLHDWHNKKDEDGVFNWYVRRSLEDAIKDLGEKISLQIQIQTKIVQHMERAEHRYRDKRTEADE